MSAASGSNSGTFSRCVLASAMPVVNQSACALGYLFTSGSLARTPVVDDCLVPASDIGAPARIDRTSDSRAGSAASALDSCEELVHDLGAGGDHRP
jgi:hypothetical protein